MSIHFTEAECHSILELTTNLEELRSSKFFPNNKHVSYSVWNIKRQESTQWIFDRLFSYFEEETGIKVKKPIDICHVHRYTEGEAFHRHTDEYYPTQIHNIGACLNDNYRGGEFQLYEPDLTLPKQQGSIYTFKSARPHEVRKIEEGERWSIISFLHVENLELRKQLL